MAVLRGMLNRVLHLLARNSPGARSIRPFLHRLRGVSIAKNVWIGDDVYLENENPELVELGENSAVNLRTTIIAHFHGTGKVVVERDVFIGCNCVIICQPNTVLTIGQGSVVAANSVISRSIPPFSFVSPPASKVIAKVTVPLLEDNSYTDFLKGLKPLKKGQ
jgi:acetyltransferase-like isoleucine patch superfamily enzyme